jgi:hypothetical protein
MLPAHVRGPEIAAFWILSWFDRLGGTCAPEDPVEVFRDAAGMITRVRVEAVVSFEDGARLDVDVELDGALRCRRAFFDRFDAKGRRAWGWHHHLEPHGVDHRHLPPGYHAKPADPPTFEMVEALLHA